MTLLPETRPSLLMRLQGEADEADWEEFVAIYRPVILRLAELKGLDRHDAEDLAQQVLLSVAKSIDRWEQDPKRARFRTWLARVVRNATLTALSRRPADRAAGGTTGMLALDGMADASADDAELFELEWRREAFRWAADQVREDFEPATWEAFWLTAVEEVSPEEAAKRTGKSVGAVYVARSRVMQKILARLNELSGEEIEKRQVADAGGGQTP
jgi:RNA polymerase sigma-70 factor (ECF subfamily)